MRTGKRFVNENGDGQIKSSFLSCEKDAETILNKLFKDSRPYSDELKRLLLIPNKDCLTARNNETYNQLIDSTSIETLMDKGIVKLIPKLALGENPELMTYLLFSFDQFSTSSRNPYYRDCSIVIDILCHTDIWDIGDYKLRPLKIAGYIDGILNQSKLSGIGRLEFMGCSEALVSEHLSGYTLMYRAIHADDDLLEYEIIEDKDGNKYYSALLENEEDRVYYPDIPVI